MALATVEAIRDRVYTLLEGITPTSLSDVKFRRYRNEGGADFEDFAEKNSAAAFRRVQVREIIDDLQKPETTSAIEERVRTRLRIAIAYPQTHRYGSANAMDRDDVINQDWLKINNVVGIYSRSNYSSTNDCTPLGATPSRETGDRVDYLVVTMELEFLRSVS